jgi:hypothetical protein
MYICIYICIYIMNKMIVVSFKKDRDISEETVSLNILDIPFCKNRQLWNIKSNSYHSTVSYISRCIVTTSFHIYMYTYLYVYVCIYIYIYSHTYISTHIFTYIYIYIHIYIYTYTYTYTYPYTSVNNINKFSFLYRYSNVYLY